MAVRKVHAQARAAQAAPERAGHVCLRPDFVDEDQPLEVEIGLAVEPRPPLPQDVWAVLLARPRSLFARDPVADEEPLDRAVAEPVAELGKGPAQLFDRDVGWFRALNAPLVGPAGSPLFEFLSRWKSIDHCVVIRVQIGIPAATFARGKILYPYGQEDAEVHMHRFAFGSALSKGLLALALLLPGEARAEASEASGKWTTAAPAPDERTEVSVTSDGARLYLLGGFGPGRQAPREVYAYDPEADSWSHITDLPEGVNHAGLAHVDGNLYVVGGFREATFEPVDDLRIYDIEADAWRDGPALPTARGALAVAVHAGRIHAIGGVDANEDRTGAHEVFDPREESWATAAPMPTPRDHLGAAAVEGRIITLAGRDGTTATLTHTEIYDVAGDAWQRGADVPTGRSGVAAVALDGFVYLFGGEMFSPRGTFDEAERYDPETDSWAALPPMPTARHGLGAGVLDGRVHVISGGPEAGLAFSDAHDVLMPVR